MESGKGECESRQWEVQDQNEGGKVKGEGWRDDDGAPGHGEKVSGRGGEKMRRGGGDTIKALYERWGGWMGLERRERYERELIGREKCV